MNVEVGRIVKRGAAYLIEGHYHGEPQSFWLTAQDVEGLSEREFLALCQRSIENLGKTQAEEFRVA